MRESHADVERVAGAGRIGQLFGRNGVAAESLPFGREKRRSG
jgi:hypothetical protein